jgi:hypothetical protein
MTRRTAALHLALALSLALPLTACSSNGRQQNRRSQRQSQRQDGRARRAGPAVAESRSGTTDTGSRYVNAAQPIGGITVETSPLAGGAIVLPYGSWPAADARATSDAPSIPEVLPAPALPPRKQMPPPPLPPTRP